MNAAQIKEKLATISISDDFFCGQVAALNKMISDLQERRTEMVSNLMHSVFSEIDESGMEQNEKDLEKNKVIWELTRINNDFYDKDPNPFA